MGSNEVDVLAASDVCFICGDGVPVVVHEGLPLCEACLDAASRVGDLPPGTVPLGAGFELTDFQ